MTPTIQDLVNEDRVYVGETMFPAKVHLPDGTTHDKVKVWVVYATHLEDTKWVMVIVDQSLEVLDAIRVTPKDFSTMVREYDSDAGKVTYYKGTGCGCGTRLRSYHPWGKSRIVAVTNPRNSVVA